jgi:hypothetical protein
VAALPPSRTSVVSDFATANPFAALNPSFKASPKPAKKVVARAQPPMKKVEKPKPVSSSNHFSGLKVEEPEEDE